MRSSSSLLPADIMIYFPYSWIIFCGALYHIFIIYLLVEMEITVENSQQAKNKSPVLPSRGICPKDLTHYTTDTCSVIFIAVLFTIAWKWKQPICPSIDKCGAFSWLTIEAERPIKIGASKPLNSASHGFWFISYLSFPGWTVTLGRQVK